MKTIRTVTFHHAHNYGSALQTYALQHYIAELGCEKGETINYQVIDFYTDFQQELYSIFKHDFSVRSLLKNCVSFFHLKALKQKHQKFETFLSQYCNLTHRYHTPQELYDDPPQADYYISGSDQIWNVRAQDFNEIYFLPFATSGKLISYAASFGPLSINWNQYNPSHYTKLLKRYNHISVRETGSANNVQRLTGTDCPILVDPTLLLPANSWRKIQSDYNYNNGRYILLYCLEPSKQQLDWAKQISQILKLPIVITRFNNKNDIINSFIKCYDAGPKDFLALIDHAALVLTSSFHGTAFSLIYHKPFYVFNGLTDNRISSILTRAQMIERSIDKEEDLAQVSLNCPCYHSLDNYLTQARLETRRYLLHALDLQ